MRCYMLRTTDKIAKAASYQGYQVLAVTENHVLCQNEQEYVSWRIGWVDGRACFSHGNYMMKPNNNDLDALQAYVTRLKEFGGYDHG